MGHETFGACLKGHAHDKVCSICQQFQLAIFGSRADVNLGFVLYPRAWTVAYSSNVLWPGILKRKCIPPVVSGWVKKASTGWCVSLTDKKTGHLLSLTTSGSLHGERGSRMFGLLSAKSAKAAGQSLNLHLPTWRDKRR